MFVDALGRPELSSDPRFASAADRAEHDAELIDELTRCFATRSASAWERVMVDAGIGVVDVFGGSTADFTNTDSVLLDTGLVTHVEHPLFGTILRHAVPVTFSETAGRVAPSPLLGEQTDALLAELGFSDGEITDLKQSGIVLSEPAVLSGVL